MSVETATEIGNYCDELATTAAEAARRLRGVSGGQRDEVLRRLAAKLRERSDEIVAANSHDLAAAPEFGLTEAQTERLRLDRKRIEGMATAVDEIIALPDPVGQTLSSSVRPNGLEVRKVRVPLGVILFIYESRPNVTSDAAALCLKSGNAVILRGGKEARHSNLAVGELIAESLREVDLPPAAAAVVATPDREVVGRLLKMDDSVDLVIPRGGESLIRRVASEATMPVLKHYQGICHVYVDASADEAMAVGIVENAKCQRPSVCNAAECLLVHSDAADRLLPAISRRLLERGVRLKGCDRTRALVPSAEPVSDADFATEYLDLVLSVRVVDDLEEAAAHIERFGSGHTETIVTRDWSAARRFVATVDSSAVLVNASTRFNDGGQFGLGAEIGISTDKFHARGPCGLEELTSYKYVVFGDGHLRD